MAWKGVITNSGSELLAQWTAGKTLTITRAAAGGGDAGADGACE